MLFSLLSGDYCEAPCAELVPKVSAKKCEVTQSGPSATLRTPPPANAVQIFKLSLYPPPGNANLAFLRRPGLQEFTYVLCSQLTNVNNCPFMSVTQHKQDDIN